MDDRQKAEWLALASWTEDEIVQMLLERDPDEARSAVSVDALHGARVRVRRGKATKADVAMLRNEEAEALRIEKARRLVQRAIAGGELTKCADFGLVRAFRPADVIRWARDRCPEFPFRDAPATLSASSESADSPQERRTLLKLVLGMAMNGYRYDPTKARNAATGTNSGSIADALSKAGLPIEADTVRKYLDEAAALFGKRPP